MEEIKIMTMVSMKEIMVAKHMARPPPSPQEDVLQDHLDSDDDSLCEVQRTRVFNFQFQEECNCVRDFSNVDVSSYNV